MSRSQLRGCLVSLLQSWLQGERDEGCLSILKFVHDLGFGQGRVHGYMGLC